MRWIVVALIALVGCKGGVHRATEAVRVVAAAEHARHEAEADDAAALAARPIPKPSGPGLAPGDYRIVDLRALAEPTRERGRPWDTAPGAEPDLKIEVFVDDRKVADCKAIDDSLAARCKLDVAIEIDAHTTLSIKVIDRDPIGYDDVGSATLVDPSTWGTGIDLPMAMKDRVASATIVLAAPAEDATRCHLLLAIGGAAALALVAFVAITVRRRRALRAAGRF